MQHSVLNDMSQTINGVKITVKIHAPVASVPKKLIMEIQRIFKEAVKNPTQYGLPLEEEVEESSQAA